MLIIVILKHNQPPPIQSKIQKSVSVIICAKNEVENLTKNLPFILNQKYFNFEVIVVDDGSDEPLTMNNEQLTIIRLTKDEKIGLGKKYALQKGIEAATKDIILLTDADCKPVSRNWITEMAALINDKHKIVLGISPYTIENSLLNSLIEYETVQTALQYIGFALWGNPYMSVGRNVCYDAKLLKTKIWSKGELAIASGDDDLAIQTLATANNTTVCLTKESYTISEAKNTWKSWFQQKTRHYESGFLYKLPLRVLLGSYLFFKLYLYVYLIFFFRPFLMTYDLLLLFVFYVFFITLLHFLLHKKLQLNSRWYFAVFNDILYCIFTLSLGIISKLKSGKNWK